jgi:hypothetical protein
MRKQITWTRLFSSPQSAQILQAMVAHIVVWRQITITPRKSVCNRSRATDLFWVVPIAGSNNGLRCVHNVSSDRLQNNTITAKFAHSSNVLPMSGSDWLGSKRSPAFRPKPGMSLDRHLPLLPSFSCQKTMHRRPVCESPLTYTP